MSNDGEINDDGTVERPSLLGPTIVDVRGKFLGPGSLLVHRTNFGIYQCGRVSRAEAASISYVPGGRTAPRKTVVPCHERIGQSPSGYPYLIYEAPVLALYGTGRVPADMLPPGPLHAAARNLDEMIADAQKRLRELEHERVLLDRALDRAP